MPSQLELKTDAEYVAFLTREYGWEIESPSYITVPQPKAEYSDPIKRDIQRMQHFLLNTYIIKDQFDQDHRARRTFLQELIPTQPDLKRWIESHSKLRKNRIRIDALFSMNVCIMELPLIYGDLSQRLQRISAPELWVGPEYDSMPFDEKVAYVRKVDDVAYRFLEELVK